MSSAVWLALSGPFIVSAISWFVRFRKTRRAVMLVGCAGSLVAVGCFVYIALLPPRPQLNLLHAGGDPVLITIRGEVHQERLVPQQLLERRYRSGNELIVTSVTESGPGESRSFPLPEARDREIVRARVVAKAGTPIEVEFVAAPPR